MCDVGVGCGVHGDGVSMCVGDGVCDVCGGMV